MNQQIKEQILLIRDSGRTNMVDVRVVQRIAYEMDLYELVMYLEDHVDEYMRFILYGEEK